MMCLELCPLAPMDRVAFHLRLYATLDKVSDSRLRLLHELRDGGKVKHGSGCLAYINCAKPKKEEVVDKVLVLSHAKFLQR